MIAILSILSSAVMILGATVLFHAAINDASTGVDTSIRANRVLTALGWFSAVVAAVILIWGLLIWMS